MTPELVLAAAALAALLGLPLFRRKEEPPRPTAAPPAPVVTVAAVAPAPKPKPPTEPLILKAFILNRKAELVGELAAEDQTIEVAYEGVLRLLEGKGLAKTPRLDAPPYVLHILHEGNFFMIAVTRSRDETAVRNEAKTLFADMLRDLA